MMLTKHYGPEVSDPVRLNVPAKRYLCPVKPAYQDRLSLRSLQSFHDQGGTMTEAEIAAFEAEANYEAALRIRAWDDDAKILGQHTPSIESFVPDLRAAQM